MYDKGLKDSTVKASLMELYPIKARVANAALKQAKTSREALKALKKMQIKELESKINSYQEVINQKVSKHDEWQATINWLKPPTSLLQ